MTFQEDGRPVALLMAKQITGRKDTIFASLIITTFHCKIDPPC